MAQFRQRFLPYLNVEDQARFQRFKHLDASHQFLIGRSLLRQSLSQALQQPAPSFSFTTSSHGRPQLAADTSVNFNVSHTQGLVAVTLADEPWLGIDVESASRDGSTLEIADRFFHPSECQAITGPAQEWQQRENFFRFWTLKEAYVKALGDGLQRSLQSFYFSLNAQKAVLLTDEKAPINNTTTRLYNYRVAPNYFCTWAAIGAVKDPQAPEIYLLDEHLQAQPLQLTPEYQSASL